MKKRLITKESLEKEICGREFFMGEDMILLPSAKDFLREKGIKILYTRKDSGEEKLLEEKVKKILEESFGINNSEILKKILEKIDGRI